jgi:hypothetical protein
LATKEHKELKREKGREAGFARRGEEGETKEGGKAGKF